ncbi:hypothetical protein CVT24_001749 [Panaeolus cyanescens]|uniref:WIBG Mago-binding domain-containing protein n=1 Tax=Panaeolus cyanescens TaxID=181874 RepID=A0A409YUC6_9AGAR|nr:hypothetical protein CVT24_001749 [Panaeolus cyanescens]
MSRPPINPDKSLAGIAVDPQTLERVVPESRRPDGSVRKQLKIRPGFTPQEDVKRFRGTRQAQMDANALPKGHIIGWAPPPTSSASSGASGTQGLSKSAKKNAKRKEKREKEKAETEAVPDNWEDDDDAPAPSTSTPASSKANATTPPSDKSKETDTKDEVSELSSKLEKLETKD